jgi:glycosyltransferase involved in cell wall biosynthesis
MNIGIDLRSLHTGRVSGVENYIVNVIEQLLAQDKTNHYTLFYNGYQQKSFEEFQYVNSKIVYKRVPNKLLNLSLKFLKYPKFENFIGDFDVLFLPNFNYFAIQTGTKLAVTVHDISPVLFPEYYNIKRRLWHWFVDIEKTLRRADVIFAVSAFTKQEIIDRFGIAEYKIHVIHPGINHSLFRAKQSTDNLREIRNAYGLPGDFMLFLNTIEPRKNIIRIIDAFEQLEKPVTLVLGGKKGWKYGNILKRIEQSPRRRLIRYLGYIPEEDKPGIIKLARAVITPSLYEGFGFPALEGLAVGTPVLTSRIASLPEVVGDSALMVDPYSVTDISFAMKELLYNEPLREQLISKGLEQAKQFNWEQTGAQLLSAFEELNGRSNTIIRI